jgi:hypothetical protein
MPQIVWTAKPDGNLDYYNKRWFDYTGMTIEQTKDWGWKHVVHPDDLQNCVERWTKTFMTGCDYEVEYRFKRALDLCFGRFVVVPYLVCTGGGCRLQFVKCHMSGCRISGSLTKPWHLPAAPDFDEQPIKDR